MMMKNKMIYDDDDYKENKVHVLRILKCVRKRNSSNAQIKKIINQNGMA
jgi:hypothetical protein